MCYGYFRSAQLSVEYLLKQRNIGKQQYSNQKPLFTLENGSVFLAARFNFKHVLELSMKALFLMANKKVPSGHDIKGICEDMKTELLNKSILQASFDAWEWLIKEYYINDKFTPNNDPMNVMDRYIYSKTGNKFPYKKIHSTTRKDLEIFWRDIKTAKNLFFRMQSEHSFIEYCKMFRLNPNKKIKSSSEIIILHLKNGRYITKRKAGVYSSKMLDR